MRVGSSKGIKSGKVLSKSKQTAKSNGENGKLVTNKYEVVKVEDYIATKAELSLMEVTLQ